MNVSASRQSAKPAKLIQIFYGDSFNYHNKIERTSDLISISNIDIYVQNENERNYDLSEENVGEFRLKAREGERYQLRFYNRSTTTSYEIVTTVDGLDVINGQTGSLSHPGYLLLPRTELMINGFRRDISRVAAFRFSGVAQSYAAHSLTGKMENVGVIGIAIYEVSVQI